MAHGRSGYGAVADSAAQFFVRHRAILLSILLSILGIATGAATAAALSLDASLGPPALIVAGAVLAAGVAAIHTRHVGLGVLAAAVPLPGLAWAAPASAGASFGAVPLLAYVFGYVLATVMAQDTLARVLDGQAPHGPLRAAAASAGLMAAMALLWFWQRQVGAAAFQAVIDITLASVSVLLLMPIGVSFLHFDEGFVAAANRVRERRQRVLERIAMVAVPRWGMSIGGISLILLALVWFGAEPALGVSHIATLPAAASAALVFLAAVSLCGGWREGFAATAVAALASLASLWALAEIAKAAPLSFVGAAQVASASLFLAFCWAQRVLTCRAQGDEPAIARLRAIEEFGAAAFFAALGAVVALAPSIAVHHDVAGYAVGVALAGAGALALMPALVTAAETLVPRRRSVEDLYRRR